MWKFEILTVFACLTLRSALAVWSCSTDQECSSLVGGVCRDGACLCPAGQQPALGGTLCANVAPYYTSQCVEDFQCTRLSTSYQCSKDDNQEGSCLCQSGSHYFLGRCWPSRDLGEACTGDAECQNTLRNPYSMSCQQGLCACADGYYLRQRGECRRSALVVGDRCVLDADCQFQNGACDRLSLTCYDTAVPQTPQTVVPFHNNVTQNMAPTNMAAKQHGVACSTSSDCQEPFECSSFDICICPLGYYSSGDGAACLAELGSPATEEQCVGLLAEIQDGVCTCPANFYFDENMRDCVKAALRLSDSCVSDAMCHTFGAASACGEAQEPWGIRSCSCIPELAVYDEEQNMCRLFVGIGEQCELDSDCLAGDVEILCQADDQGIRRCTCPEGLTAFEGLCLNTGLGLGQTCQVSQECTGTENSACVNGVCGCEVGYQTSGDLCTPELGGACAADADCQVQHAVCASSDAGDVCQCAGGFTEYDSLCWSVSAGHNSSCSVDAQCVAALGAGARCADDVCACGSEYHHRGGGCWLKTGLFEQCTRSSECFLDALTERTVCRNGLCQCDFDYPYSEELHTCVSGASTISGSVAALFAAALYLILS